MIIDFHTHIFPDKIASKTLALLAERSLITPSTNGIATGLVESMQCAKVDKSVVLPVVTSPKQFQSITNFALKINETYDDLISFGGVHPDSQNYKEELRELKRLGFIGIKIHPDYQGHYIDDIEYLRLIEEACNQDFVISIHSGFDAGLHEPVHCTPQKAERMLKEVKPHKLVLAHCGDVKDFESAKEYLFGRDVYLDTAVTMNVWTKEQMNEMIQIHGSNRILFATDSPWSDQKKSLETLNHLSLSSEKLNAILYENASSLLKI